MKIAKILVATDLSTGAENALETALDVARHAGAAVVLVHATKPSTEETPFRDPPTELRQALELLDRERRAYVDELRERYADQGVEISYHLVDAVPARGIVDAAVELDADLVVVGNTGRKGLKALLLGSVAKRVVRHCKRSVLVARGRPEGAGPLRRVLVPTDFSAAAENALETALAIVAEGGTIELLHCWRLPAEGTGGWAMADKIPGKQAKSLRSLFEKAAREQGEELIARYRNDRSTLEFACFKAHAKEGILRRLKKQPFDVAVMGSRGHRGLSRWLLGSVAEAVVQHAPCAVLVARDHQREGDESLDEMSP